MTLREPRWAVAGLALALAACQAANGPGGDGGDGTTTPSEDPQGLVEQGLECVPDAVEPRGFTFDAVRRLSRSELELTLRDLIGDDLYADDAITPRVQGLPSDQALVPGDFSLTPPVGWPGVLNQIAERVSLAAETDLEWRQIYLHTCTATQPVDSDCLLDVVITFGERVWRRPLTDDEIDDYMAFADEFGAGEQALSLLVRRFLQAPSLVFHIEDGTGEEFDDGRLRLTEYEVASRISYLTTGGPPDEALYIAAADGTLSTIEGVSAEVDRLLDTPESRARVSDFFRFYTHVVPGSDPDPALADLNGVDPAGLGQAIHDEAYVWFDDLVYGGGTYVDLMTSTTAHPTTPAAAALFGADGAGGPVEAPDHPGLLHRPALLVSYGDRTSPIIRGAHLRKLYLCADLGLPDPAAIEEAQEELGDTSDLTNRDAVDALTAGGNCVGCHTLINPLGHLFEGYDQLGMVRSQEVILDSDGNVERTFPIDTTVDNPYIGSEPIAVDDSLELVGLLAHSIQARQCLSRRMVEYFYRDAFDKALDTCTVVDVDDEARDGTLRDAFVATIANSDIFWKEAPQ